MASCVLWGGVGAKKGGCPFSRRSPGGGALPGRRRSTSSHKTKTKKPLLGTLSGTLARASVLLLSLRLDGTSTAASYSFGATFLAIFRRASLIKCVSSPTLA
jgi:hypothetical protein